MGYLYPKKTPKSTHRGVKFAGVELGKRLWVATFTHEGRSHTSPKFRSEVKAAKWYDREAVKHLGDRAVINYPKKVTPKRKHFTPLPEPIPSPVVVKRTREDDEEDSDEDSDDKLEDGKETTTTTYEISTIHIPEDDEETEIEYKFITESKPTPAPKSIPKPKKRHRGRSPSPAPQAKQRNTSTKRKKFPITTRQRICARQRWNCNFCHRRLADVFTIDHMVPLFLGGSNQTWNLQAICPSCDQFKTSFIDNKILEPLSKTKDLTPQDVLQAQTDNYYRMECRHPDEADEPSSPSRHAHHPPHPVTNNITLNMGDFNKLMSEITELKSIVSDLKKK